MSNCSRDRLYFYYLFGLLNLRKFCKVLNFLKPNVTSSFLHLKMTFLSHRSRTEQNGHWKVVAESVSSKLTSVSLWFRKCIMLSPIKACIVGHSWISIQHGVHIEKKIKHCVMKTKLLLSHRLLTLLLMSRAGSCGLMQAWAILITCSSFLGCSSTLAARNNVVWEII